MTTTKTKMATVTIENAKMIFRNFAGRKGPYNEEGERSFTLVMGPDIGVPMMEAGWNVKEKAPYGGEEGAPSEFHLPVMVEYRKGRPPRCVLIREGQPRTELGADEVAIIDYGDIQTVDLTLNPYEWDVNGNQGVKAYLKTIFVTLVVDELDLKYGQIPDAREAVESFDPLDQDD